MCAVYVTLYDVPSTGATNVFVLSFAHESHYLCTLAVTDPYTFSVKSNWQMAAVWGFTTRSLAVAYLRTPIPLGHSTEDAPGTWEVWWQYNNRRMKKSGASVLSRCTHNNFTKMNAYDIKLTSKF